MFHADGLRSKLLEQIERKHLERIAEVVLEFQRSHKVRIEQYEQQDLKCTELEANVESTDALENSFDYQLFNGVLKRFNLNSATAG